MKKPGTWVGRCAEYCGLSHWQMSFTLRALPPAEFQRWLDRRRGRSRSRSSRNPEPAAHVVTILEERPTTPGPAPAAHHHPSGLLRWLTSSDHKDIGIAYMVTAFSFYLIGGLMAMVMRAQLAQPEQNLVSDARYNELFTMHGSIMLFLFLGSFAFGLANFLVPLQIGARDMAFPRLNQISYWVYLSGGVVMISGFFTSSGAASFGWFAYTPLSDGVRSPGLGGDFWIIGITLVGISGILTAVNVVTTIATMRAPGMTMLRMPIFTWNMLVTTVLVLMVFPVLTAAGVMLYADRHYGAHIFDANHGGVPVLWQHLFWFFGHPEVYILVLPFFGVVTEVFAVFSRKPVFGYKIFVAATVAIGILSIGVWAHHMYATGVVLLPFFGFLTMLIAVPTGIKFFNWIGTMWGGSLTFDSPTALRDRVPAHLRDRRRHRRDAGVARRSTSTSPTPTSSSRTSTTCCSAARCSRSSPASTTGSRSSPAASCTRGGRRRSSG